MRSTVVALTVLALALLGTPAPGQEEVPPVGRLLLSSIQPGADVAGIADVRSDTLTGVPQALLTLDSSTLWPRFSPDGTQLVFQARDADGDWELFVMDSRGGDPVQVTTNTFSDGYPAWGPDGVLVSASDPDDTNNPEIMLTDLATGSRVRLTDHPAIDTAPDLSPDGSRVAFLSNRAGTFDVWTMALDGSDLVNLTPGTASDQFPEWSPDGQQIAWGSNADGAFDVWVMDRDGGNKRNLTRSASDDEGPTWSPDGSWIAFTTDRFEGADRDVMAVPLHGGSDPQPVAITTADEFSVEWGPLAPVEVVRLAGPDRVATAIAIADQAWNPPLQAAVLARSDAFPDALAGGPLAVQVGGPMLLTGRNGLHPATAEALQRLLPGPVAGEVPTVYLLGGTAALSEQVEVDVQALGYRTVRASGPTRFDTAVEIAGLVTSPGPVFVADGEDFRPSLLAGAVAANAGGEVVLTAGSTLPGATADHLTAQGTSARVIAVGSAAAAVLPDVEAIDGTDPYELSTATATWVEGVQPANVALASGVAFPDGLTGGAHARWSSAPLLLTDPADLPDSVWLYLAGMTRVRRLFVYGGTAAVSDAVVAQAYAALQGP